MKLIPLLACTTLMTLSLRLPTRPKTSGKKKRTRNANGGAQMILGEKKTRRREEKKTRDANEGAQIILGKKNMKSAEKKKYAMREGRDLNNTWRKKDAARNERKKHCAGRDGNEKANETMLGKNKNKKRESQQEGGSSGRERKGARKEGRKDWQKVGMNNPCLI